MDAFLPLLAAPTITEIVSLSILVSDKFDAPPAGSVDLG